MSCHSVAFGEGWEVIRTFLLSNYNEILANNDDFNDLNDPESMALKKKLKGRQQQMSAEEMKQGGNILGGKVEEIKGKLNERSADANLKKISENELASLRQDSKVS